MTAPDENLRPYASPAQWKYLEAVAEHGSQRAAARALGVNQSGLSRGISVVMAKAARHGYAPDHDLTHPAPTGFRLKGSSTLYDKRSGEPVMQWVKTTADEEAQAMAMREAIKAMAEDLPREKPVKAPAHAAGHLAACYPVGDHHFGMLAWHEETGADYDLPIGERLLTGAMDHLVASAPAAGTGLVVLLGDFMHYDSFKPMTPTSGHLLDADSRFPKMVRAAVRSVRYMIRAALAKHAKVHVIVEIGNHDLSASIFLMECLANIYEGEKRVTIDTSPSQFHYWRFGKCLLGVHHGHSVKLPQLPLLMAADRPQEWGATVHRYWWTGHVHHDQVKEFNGVKCESFRILPPADAYAANAGYRTGRDMKCIVLHQEHGEVARHTVNPAMLDAAA